MNNWTHSKQDGPTRPGPRMPLHAHRRAGHGAAACRPSWRSLLLAVMVWMTVLAQPAAGADGAGGAQIKPVDRIVAVVNDDAITQLQLNDQLDMVTKQLQQKGIPLPPRDVLEKQLLERMINDQVQLQFAKQTGIRVDDTELDQSLQRIAQQNKMTLPQFRATLEKQGIDFAKFREEIRDEIILSKLRERDVDNRIVVTDGEVENYLKTQAALGGKENQYELAHILIMVPDNASPEQIRAKQARAEEAMEKLREGADFGQIAASYSDAPDALQGGMVGWKSAGQLPTLFLDALKGMKPGDVSPLLRSPNGFHIIRLVGERDSAKPTVVTQTHVRHILIKTNELVSQADAKNRLLELKQRLEHGADFAALARQYSDDASASSGGDLGWVSPGDTVPAFEHAMDALKPGEISDPVHTPFGWHLIQVLGRRTQDITKERQQMLARQAIRERKSDEAYQDFVRQLRDQAYVENRLDDKQ